MWTAFFATKECLICWVVYHARPTGLLNEGFVGYLVVRDV